MSEIPADIMEAANKAAGEWFRAIGGDSYHFADAIARAILAERERCANIAEEFPAQMIVMWDRPGGPPGNGTRATNFKDLAAVIRRVP